MSCAHCGKPLPTPPGRFCAHCGESTPPSEGPRLPPEVSRAAASATQATRRAAEHTASAVQNVLEDPRLRERLPGRSLALLGAGLVALAILLSLLPLFSGIGFVWSAVMLTGSVLIGARELHAAGRPLPAPVLRAAQVAEHPHFLPAFTLLTFVQAFMTLTLGVVPLLWLLAAIVLGYDQRHALRPLVANTGTPTQQRLGRWVLVGALVCATSMWLLSWGYGGGYFLGGFQPYHVREMQMDGFTRNYVDHYEFRYDSMVNYMPPYVASGRSRPFASLTVLALGALVVLARARPRRFAAYPWLLPVLAGAVTLWALLGLVSRPGPWLFLAGALVISAAVARDFLMRRRT
ncbi:hypothetical protein [Stigmatella aurantiaca]|uniref:Zinc-ribbon domain-containing protein n=1 Tax=Stigmatella aurantiaca (strain DW4/3-1) TaxID=378806 RepID=Q08U24_STIAD|nr:hypothetical protein [Stigmatella aurantiaca]ADO75656.1 uncharacterized protein STAUR_7901 [Stigmatella aurantiaca DW4/3-1]EAU63984.1 hypothetical protein STIAU_3860 [Stigmatella aurantiaca DW4/3-1]